MSLIKKAGILTAGMMFSFVSQTFAQPPDMFQLTADIRYGCTTNFVKGVVGATNAAPGIATVPVTKSRSYLEWYKNGVFTGSKQSPDGYPTSSVETDNCTHSASASYWMPYSVYVESSTQDGRNVSGNLYW